MRNWHQNPKGVYSLKGCHDGYLLGICLSGSKELEVKVASIENELMMVKFPGLEYLTLNNFKQGNIIFDLMIYESSQCPHELIRKAMGHSIDDWEEVSDSAIQSLAGKSWIGIELTSSYGCEFHAICFASKEEVSLEPPLR
jgi:hypothetical protein